MGLGIGFGGTFIHRSNNTNGLRLFATFSPRVGVQIWRFRFTCDFDIMSRLSGFSSTGTTHKIYSSILALNLGYVF